MKQCPVCKSTYTDDSLKFCLNDGAALSAPSASSADVTQEMTFGSAPPIENHPPIRVNIQPETPTQISAPRNTTQTERRGINLWTILAIVALFAVIGIAGITVAYFLFVKSDNLQNLSKTDSPRSTPIEDNNSNETQTLKEELERLKKQVGDQKNAKRDSAIPNTPISKPTQQQSIVTARVYSPGDGFLSLRTEPSIKTGTQMVKIPTGATVEIEDCQRNFQTVDTRRGRWCMVTYNGQIGWVFDAWLVY